jgi:hypothetical protein
VAKSDLPREVGQRSLDYAQLVSTLEMIDGERVIVRIASRETDDESTAGVASILGELHHVPARYEGHESGPYAPSNPSRPNVICLAIPSGQIALLRSALA